MAVLFQGVNSAGALDYVAAWFLKAAQLMQSAVVKTAFVSTNSITQGEQVGILWNELLTKYHVKIQFAHRTFKWSNEARGNANVFCVIVGFGLQEPNPAVLNDYATPRSEAQRRKVSHINPYLIDAEDVVVSNRSKPLSAVPPMLWGSKPTDGGHLILSDEEKEELVATEPEATKFIRQYVGAQEFIHNQRRWCLWLVDASPADLKALPNVRQRVEAVRRFRLQSVAASTRDFAIFPTLFRQRAQPTTDYLIVPLVSSESRRYIPIGFMSPTVVASNLCSLIPNATLYLFGIITSEMHMAWMRQVCGRLKSDFRYSGTLVYNNFPFPTAPPLSKLPPSKPPHKQCWQRGPSFRRRAWLPSTTRSRCRRRWCAPTPPSTVLWMPATAPLPSPPN